MGLMWQLRIKQNAAHEQDVEELATGYRIPAKLMHDPDPLDKPPGRGLQKCRYFEEIGGYGHVIPKCSGHQIILPCGGGRTYGEVAYSAVGQWRNGSCIRDPASRAWTCPGIPYGKMVVESLDPDNSSRQVNLARAANPASALPTGSNASHDRPFVAQG